MSFFRALMLILFSLMIGIPTAFAAVQIKTAQQFSQVKKIIQTAIKKNGGAPVLVVFDDDDTLLTMPEGLGSVGWTEWQEKLYRQYKQTGKRPAALVAETLGGIYQIEGILFSLSQMNPTAQHIPSAIRLFAKEGANVMVATARSPSDADATLLQLIRASFTTRSGEIIFNKTAPKTQTGHPDSNGIFYPSLGKTHRPLLYLQGIYFLSGQNKGEMLINFLKRFNVKNKTTLIFVDDQMRNVKDVYQAMRHYPAMRHVISIHYTKENARQNILLKNKKAHLKAEKAWEILTTAIKKTLPKNQLPS